MLVPGIDDLLLKSFISFVALVLVVVEIRYVMKGYLDVRLSPPNGVP